MFLSDSDRRVFLSMAVKAFRETATDVLAWAMMPNHVHFLLTRPAGLLAEPLQRLLGGYAVYFNGRYSRVGALWQGRYGARSVADLVNAAGVLRYVDGNPLKDGLVEDVDELSRFAWSGFGALLGFEDPFDSRRCVSRFFGVCHGDLRNWTLALFDPGVSWCKDGMDRYLGVGGSGSGERKEYAREVLLSQMAQLSVLNPGFEETIRSTGKTPKEVAVRSWFCAYVSRRYGLTGAEIADHLGRPRQNVAYWIARGRCLAGKDLAIRV